MIDDNSKTPAGIGLNGSYPKPMSIFALVIPILLFAGLSSLFGYAFVISDYSFYFYLMLFFGIMALVCCVFALIKSPKVIE